MPEFDPFNDIDYEVVSSDKEQDLQVPIDPFKSDEYEVTKGDKYDTGEYRDIGETIDRFNLESEKISEKLKESGITPEGEEQERLDEIDITIDKIQKEQERISEKEDFEIPSIAVSRFSQSSSQFTLDKSKDIDTLSEEIVKLREEKSKLQNKLKPVSKEEISDIENNYGIFQGYKDSEIIEKYGINRTNKIYSKSIDDKYKIISNEKIKQGTPESILSYDNLLYGKEDQKLNIPKEDIDNIYNEALKNPDYRKSMYDKKRNILYKEIKNYVVKKEYEDKDAAAKKIMNNMLVKFAQAENGNLSVEGYKLYAEYNLEKVQYVLDQNIQALGSMYEPRTTKFGEKYTPNLPQINPLLMDHTDRDKKKLGLYENHGKENINQWDNNLKKDIQQLIIAKDYYESILKMPEARQGIRDVGKALGSLSVEDFMLGFPDMSKSLGVTKIAKKIERGETPTYGERMILEGYATQQFAGNYDTQGKWYNITRGAALMAPYVAEFAMTSGVSSFGKQVVTKGLAKVAEKYIKKSLPRKLADITAANIGRLSGAALQATALPQMYIKNTAENIRPDIVLDPQMDGIQVKVETNTGDPLLKGAIKGYSSTVAEMAWEQSGKYLTAIPKAGGRLINLAGQKLTGKAFLKKKVLDDFMKMKGIRTIVEGNKYFEQHHLGWDGILGEQFEELGTYFTEKGIQGEKIKFDKQFWDDQLITLGTIALFGGPVRLVGIANSYIAGNNMIFIGKDKNDKDFKIKIPKEMYSDFNEVITSGEGMIDHDKMQAFYDKHSEEMTEEQFQIFFSQTVYAGRDRLNNLIEEDVKGKPKRKDGLPEDFDPSIDLRTKEEKEADLIAKKEVEKPVKLPKEELEEVEQSNKEMIKKHPDLAANDLLFRDKDSGQYLEPTSEIINDYHKAVISDLKEKTEYDEARNITNPEDIEKLTKQKEVLDVYMSKLEGIETPFEKLKIKQKQERIISDLKSGKELTGTTIPVFGADVGFIVKLDDGRKVKAVIDSSISTSEKKKAVKAIENSEKVDFKLEPQEDWNPDLSIKDLTGKPYGDRITISHKGNHIGFVQVTDFAKVEKEKKEKKISESVPVNELTKKVEDIFSGFKTSTPIEKEDKPIIDIKDKKQTPIKNLKNLSVGDKGIYYTNLKGSRQDWEVDKNVEVERVSKYGIKFKGNKEWKNFKDKWHNFVPAEQKDIPEGLVDQEEAQPHQIEEYEVWKENYDQNELYLYDFIAQNNIKLDTEYSYSEIRKLIKARDSKLLNAVNRMFNEVLNKVRTKVIFTEKSKSRTAAGYFDYQLNKIVISITGASNGYANRKTSIFRNSSQFTPENWLKSLFMHESGHAFTSLKIKISEDDLNKGINLPDLTDNENKAIFGLNNLFDYVKNNNPEDIKHYGLKNIQEFISEGLSNPDFIKFLANTEVPESNREDENMLVAFVRYIMQLLGLNKTNNNAFNELIILTNDLSKDFNPDQADLVKEQYLDLLDLLGQLPPAEIYLEDQIDETNKDQILRNFLGSINNIDWTEVANENLIEKIFEGIDNIEDLSEGDKGYMKGFVRSNEAKIIKSISQKKLKSAGFTKEYESLNLDSMLVDSIVNQNGVVASGEQKLNSLLQGFAPIWRTIADKLGITRDQVENTMYRIAKQPGILTYLQNEDVFENYIETLDIDDSITIEIVKVLKNSSFDSIISLFNFYNNVHLTKQYGMLYNKGKFVLRLLNPSQRYDEFVDSFRANVRNFKTKDGYQGYEAIQRRISRHNEERDRRFHSKGQSWSWFDSQTSEERTALRKEQHGNDIVLLGELTGISESIWSQYFNKQTKETQAFSSSERRNIAEYGTYENLLENDTWRGKYRRIQSNLVFNLGLTLRENVDGRSLPRTLKSFTQAFDVFFTQGNEQTGALSNIYKLTTSVVDKDDIGMSGVDIKGDRFNSFIQSSNITTIAQNILNSNVNNKVVNYYKTIEKEIEIVMINGLHNLGLNKDKKGTQNLNMSNEDIWMSQFMMFMEEGNTYLHWIGQFGDKPSLSFIEVEKYINISKDDIKELKKDFPKFDEAVNWFIDEYLLLNADKISGLYKGVNIKNRQEKRVELATNFIYNFAKNINDTNELFFGNKDSYKNDLIDMVKRAGSSNSPGYKMNEFVEGGVGSEYQFALINDEIKDILGKEWEMFDGIEFMTGDYALRTQKSMGSVFSRKDEEGFEILDSVKALTTFIDPITGLRGLTKTNRVNIDVLADIFPKGNKYDQLKKFMKDRIDVLSFTSGTKKFENNINSSDSATSLWNEDGTEIKNPKINDLSIVTRKTSDVYVQQDLRHSNVPKTTKMPSQMLVNILMFDDGPEISKMINTLQKELINDMITELDKGTLDEAKIDWLLENVNQETQSDIYRLLEKGMTPYEPALANLLRKMLSGTLTRKALEIPVNRLTTQEIPDVDGLLEGRRKHTHPEKDGTEKDYILLPDISANIHGARYENDKYKGNYEKAIKFVNMNKSLHKDLFDLNGNLMEFEIHGRNGIIPGELVISTRVPADDLHSHTVGRLKYQIKQGNFTMLDRNSQKISGSDFDGDQRFNQVFYKKNGNIFFNETKEGISNQIMMHVALDYMNPKYDRKIQNAINTNKYDKIVDKYRKSLDSYSFLDSRNYDRARNENMVGVKMKGILTDATTLYSLLAPRNINFKKDIIIGNMTLSGFVQDSKGLMKDNMDNFLNMAFDNATDPKIEIMGLNEITSNMFVLSFLGNKKVDVTNDKVIMKHIENIVEYFNSPIIKDFTKMIRKQKGGLRREDIKNITRELSEEHNSNDVKQLINFYKLANELPKLRRFYGLTQRASGSTVEFYTDKSLYDSVSKNSNNDFKLINVKNLFIDKSPITEFAISEDALDLSERYIFSDTFNYSQSGQQIINAVMQQFEKKKFFTQDEMKSLDYGLSNMAALRALGVKGTARNIEQQLINNIDKYRLVFPNNQFLETVQKVIRGNRTYIEIAPDYRRAKIGEEKLKKIREDFDSLWSSSEGKEIAEKFVANNLYQKGASTSTFGGGYYSLLGDDFRVYYSKLMQNELRDWQLDDLSVIEKMQITEWLLRASKIEDFNKKAINPSQANYYDYESLSVLNTPLSYEAMDGLTGITSANEFIEYAKEHEFNAEELRDEVNKIFNQEFRSVTKEIIPAVKSLQSAFEKKAAKLFPPDTSTGIEPKNMLPQDSIGEVLATEDQELQDFVYDRLQKMYPTVEIFNDRNSFMTFVKKWGDKGLNIDQRALGHAFANAVFVDKDKSVQSTLFHEHTHIYWDALPKNNKVKKALILLYKEENPEASIDTLEELIILDIGIAGTDIALVELNSSRLNKFIELLKNFWREVKSVFGRYSKIDLVNQLAWDIWHNSDNIVPNTNYGQAIVNNMISYNFSKEEVGFNTDEHIHFINGIPVPAVTSLIKLFEKEGFDVSEIAKNGADKLNRMYFDLSKEKLTKEDIQKENEYLIKLYSETVQERGTDIHAIGEAIFKNVSVEKGLRDNFEGDTFQDARKIFIDLKERILEDFPNAIFYSEPHIISKKFQVGGFADLVVDTGDVDINGNHELLLYDFKTTEKGYSDEDMKPIGSYKEGHGFYKAPFENLPKSKYVQHMLQLNMYANMIEEQFNPDNPGVKNKVVRTRIIPIIRKLNKKGLVSEIKEAFWVRIPRNERTIDIANKMMDISYLSRKDTSKMYPEYRKVLQGQDVPPKVVDEMMKSLHFIELYTGGIKKINKDHVGDIRNEGFTSIQAKLLSSIDSAGLGYNIKDLEGPDALTSEELFYIATESITKNDYFGYTDKETGIEYNEIQNKRYIDKPVYSKFVPKENPKRSKSRWSKFGKLLVKEVGLNDLTVGDEIMMIYQIDALNDNPLRFHNYIVLDVNKDKNRIEVTNQENGLRNWINSPSDTNGIYMTNEILPNNIKEPAENSWVPTYIYDAEETFEKHWDHKLNKNTLERESQVDKSVRESQQRQIWRFFENNKTWSELSQFFDNSKDVTDLYEKLSTFDNELSMPIVTLTMQETVNHWMSEIIRRENNDYDKVPKNILRQTLNLYRIFTNSEDAIFNDFGKARLLRSSMPARMMEANYAPLNLLNGELDGQNKKYIQESYKLGEIFKKFEGKIDFDLVQNKINKSTFWKKPDTISRSAYPLEREFLEEIYLYYRKFDPKTRAAVEIGRDPRIEISSLWATLPEFKAKFGKRFGKLMHDKLKPQSYDFIELDVIIGFDKKNNPIYNYDKSNKKIVRTLSQIKEDYVAGNNGFTDAEKSEYLGPKWRHKWLRIPGTTRVFGSVSKSGILNYQIKEAIQIYDKKLEGKNNKGVGVKIKRSKRTVPIIGRGKVSVQTELLVEAEQKAIDSMIFAHYMKELIGPLDWMIIRYKNSQTSHKTIDKNITEWIKNIGEYQIFGTKSDNNRITNDTIDYINRLNSLNKIAMSITTQGFNLAIGQFFDIVREPGAYFKGIAAFAKGGNFLKNIKKYNKIINRYGLANIVDEKSFDQKDKEFRIMGIDLSKIEGFGYAPMTLAEKMNQIPLFIGLMTKEELNAYDDEGNIKDRSKNQHLSNYRRNIIESRVKDVHGDYSKINAAPFWFSLTGKIIMPFRKWMPTMINSHFRAYHISDNYEVRSGILPTIAMFGKMLHYNLKSDTKRQKEREEEIKRLLNDNNSSDEIFFNTIDEYFKTIKEAVDGNKITFKDLSSSDRRNLVSATIEGLIIIFKILSLMGLFGDDDPDRYKKFARRTFARIFNRFQSDALFVYNPESYSYLLENLLPQAQLITDIYKFIVDLAKWGGSLLPNPPEWTDGSRYGQDEPIARKGTPKFIIGTTRFLPYGSGARQLQETQRLVRMKNNMFDLREYGVTQETLDKIGHDSFFMSEFDINENSYKWDKIFPDLIKAKEINTLLEKGIDPETYYAVKKGKIEIEQELDQLEKALKMLALQKRIDEGKTDGITDKYINEGANVYDRFVKPKKDQSDRKTKREFEEAKENIKKQ